MQACTVMFCLGKRDFIIKNVVFCMFFVIKTCSQLRSSWFFSTMIVTNVTNLNYKKPDDQSYLKKKV